MEILGIQNNFFLIVSINNPFRELDSSSGAADKMALFLWSVGDQVYTLLESLVVPRLLTDTELTYDELIKLLDTHIDDSKNIMSST